MTRVGVDLIEIARVRRSLERYEGFRDRCFTPAEQAYCDSRKNPAESYAGRFAGKEAVGKALGFGVARAFAWKDIEIAGRPKPSVRLSGRVAAWAERVDAGAIDLSMTHSRELASAARILREAGRDAVETTAVEQADVIVDGLFGTGFHGEPRDEAASMIERINAAASPVVSVDVPSGVDASTGEVAGAGVRAALTVTFHGRKLGLAVAPGLFHAGEVVVADIGLEATETQNRLTTAEIVALVPRKRPEDSKYTAGAVLIVGGAPGMTGAVCLAAEAALRADAGYVTVAVPEPSLPVVEANLLEPVKLAWADARDATTKARALAIGPGLGRDAAAKALRDELIDAGDQSLVLDADALHELAPGGWGARAVLTPHAGELGRLLGESSGWVDAHRLEAARRGAERFGCICLLKGADTIVAGPSEGVLIAIAKASGLATAGTGDVLTGILAAFLAKGLEPRLAAAAAATAHGLAARSLPQRGMIASDVISALPGVLP